MRSAECGVRSVKMQSVENAECGKCGVWKMRSVENAECVLLILNSQRVRWITRSAECGVRSVENAECRKCGVCFINLKFLCTLIINNIVTHAFQKNH